MKKVVISIMLAMCCVFYLHAQKFEAYFTDETLRIDYIFGGNASQQQIYLDELIRLPSWAGRKHHMSELPLRGNGQIVVRDPESRECIYTTSFSSLFQEWLTTEEAEKVNKSFENTFLVPFPLKPVEVEITLRDMRHEVIATMKHMVDPKDVLIHRKGTERITPHKYLLKSGNAEDCIDIAIVAEGYTEAEMDLFLQDASNACEAIFDHEPFKSMKDKFNMIAVQSPSAESGVSIPGKSEWKQTAFSSNFDTFYSARYLTTSRVKAIHDALAGIPYEHIVILANTEQYGGGGIYNAYTLTTAHHPMFRPVVVHEVGHSFAGLGDEYFYENDTMSDTYPLDIEPWEQNITTLVDFSSKWEDMLESYPVGKFEGGGYTFKGVYRPVDNCRMRTNDHPDFCPVCQRSISRMIRFYTEKE